MRYTQIKRILGIVSSSKYEFLDFENTSNNGAYGIGYSINGGGYITLIREGENIVRIVIERQKFAPNQDPYSPQGISSDAVINLITAFYNM